MKRCKKTKQNKGKNKKKQRKSKEKAKKKQRKSKEKAKKKEKDTGTYMPKNDIAVIKRQIHPLEPFHTNIQHHKKKDTGTVCFKIEENKPKIKILCTAIIKKFLPYQYPTPQKKRYRHIYAKK